jgi:photosystem II stability/assembly factor-like uncharacterized protein
MRHLSVLILLVLGVLQIDAQPLDTAMISNLNARSIGPAGMSGRVTGIDVVRDHPNTIYVATASGGVWKSTSGGTHWDPIFDKEATQNIGCIQIAPSNSQIIWVGTGEGNPRNSQSNGYGVYKSLNGGKDWQFMGLPKTRNIHRIIIHPTNPDVVYVGAQGPAWGTTDQRGVFKTTDGGKTWKKILYVNDSTGVADMVIDPRNPNKLIVALWQMHREPYVFKSGGSGSGLYLTVDGGESWSQITEEDGLPKGEIGRIGLSIAPSSPNIVYALIESEENGLYKSTDGGYKWSLVSKKNIGNRPFYYADIFVDPKNENRIYNLWSMVSRSEDGGKTFEIILPYSGVHPDHHAWYIHPDNPDYLIDGNDGGLNISRDRGRTWRFVENLPLAQFYHINYDLQVPYNVYGGMQDNGSWRGPSRVTRWGGIRNSYWDELFFGDGFDVVPDLTDENKAFAMYQGGNVALVDFKTGVIKGIKPTHPDGEKLRFNWNAAIAQSPRNPETIYFGSQYVHRSNDKGMTWEIISPDLTTNDSTKINLESGGLTIDVTGAENYCSITTIEPSKTEQDVIWAGTDDGNVYVTRDNGQTWQLVNSKMKGLPTNAWIHQIVSGQNSGEAFVVTNNYRQDDYTPYIYYTTDYGKTWSNVASNLPENHYCLSFVQDFEEDNLWFAGTENGLFISIDKGENWTRFNNEYPNVSTYDMKLHPVESDLIIGTFGRAAYIIDNIDPLRKAAKTMNDVFADSLSVFDIPTAYLTEMRTPKGIRFDADGMFNGENKGFTARIPYHVLGVNEDKPSDTLFIHVVNSNGDTVRTVYDIPGKNGLNYGSWWLDFKGFQTPSREWEELKYEPGISYVQPGVYTLHLEFGNHTTQGNVDVQPLPGMPYDASSYDALMEYIQEVRELSEMAVNQIKRLTKSSEILADIQKQVAINRDTTFSSQIDSLKSFADSTNKVLTKILDEIDEIDEREGYTPEQDDFINAYYAAYSACYDFTAPNQTDRNRLSYARKKWETIQPMIDQFYENEWEKLKRLWSETQWSPFEN